MSKITQIKAPQWAKILNQSIEEEWFTKLLIKVEHERQIAQIFPSAENMFKAFQLTPFNEVKVVIIGQDPYHGLGQANGLAFSVNRGVKIPPSLRNIYKELHTDLGINPPDHGDLTTWAQQGVLLINSVLTVEEAKAGSHRNYNWQKFTDLAIHALSEHKKGIVFLLWGNYAIEKEKLIDINKHHILKSTHPSPLSAYRGFLGCRHFSETNSILMQQNRKPIDWGSISDV